MLSYQHQYHAGNHADVLKHWLLLECLAHLQKKDKPFDYIDTHAGGGLYRLDSEAARKTGEASEGVLKLPWDSLPELQDYRASVADDLNRKYYPGSPLLVSRRLRPGDRGWFFEMHPATVRDLEKHCGKPKSCRVKREDGFAGLTALLPTASRRALVLIDPSYEVKSDYRSVVSAVAAALKKMPQTQILLWYPVVSRERVNTLEKDIIKAGLRNSHLFEISIDDDAGEGMTASGLIAINPPWTTPERFKSLAPGLSAAMARDGKPRWRYQVLVPE